MADVQILAQGVSAAPLAYTVPDSVQIILKSAAARFDGTSAAGAWLPAVRLTSPAGIVQARAITETQVAAGASADVSFFPGAKPAAAAASSAALSFAIAYRNNFNVPQATPPVEGITPWDYIDVTGSDVALDGSGHVKFLTQGLYMTTTACQVFSSTWSADANLLLNFTLDTGGLGNHISGTWPGLTEHVLSTGQSGTTFVWETSMLVWVNIFTPGEVTTQFVQVGGSSTPAVTRTFAVMSILRVGDAASGGVS